MTQTTHRKLTQAELMVEAQARFGDDPLDFAFICPHCGDVAAIREFPEGKRDRAGQECIGRSLGALERRPPNVKYKGRGCDWTAYGFFPGPWEVVMPDGHSANGFALAEAKS